MGSVLLNLWSVIFCNTQGPVYMSVYLAMAFLTKWRKPCFQEAIESIDATSPGANHRCERARWLFYYHSAVRSVFSEAQRDRLMKFCVRMVYILRSSYQRLGNASRLEVLALKRDRGSSAAQCETYIHIAI